MKKIIMDELFSNTPILRKSRILRCISCYIILFTVFCEVYWDVLTYINFPNVPLFPEHFRNVINITALGSLAVWVLVRLFYDNIYRIIDEKNREKVQFLGFVIEFFCSILLVMYSLNLLIEYVNNKKVNISWIVILISSLYLLYCLISKLYYIQLDYYKKNQILSYTNYCDTNGVPIPKDAIVYYKGRKCKVIYHENEYKLQLYSSKLNPDYVKLDDAASDISGNLLLKR